jgi:hypothetical protein
MNLPEVCRRTLVVEDDIVSCGGFFIEFLTEEGDRKVVDLVCQKCGARASAPIVVHDPRAVRFLDELDA